MKLLTSEVQMKRIKQMFKQAPLSKFVQSCLSLTAFTILGSIVIEPVNAASLHTGFASYSITDLGPGNAFGMNNRFFRTYYAKLSV
jgi:hypothetical protein